MNNLEEVETIMMEELRFYQDKEKTINAKAQRLATTDRICKAANVVLAIENLKERRKMNKTDRMSEVRKTNQANHGQERMDN